MGRETPVMAFFAGVTVFVLTVLPIEALLGRVVESGLLLALPIGIGMGMAAMTVVYVGMGDDPSSRHYRAAFALGALGVTFVFVLGAGVVSGGGFHFSVGASLVAGVITAVGVAIGFR